MLTNYRSRAPVRISFGGGGTDVSPYCDERGGCVVNAAIDRYNYASGSFRNDEKVVIDSADYVQSLLYHSVKEMGKDPELALVKASITKMNPVGKGLEVYVRSDVPPKSGLGGSASAFVAMIGLFNEMNGVKMDRQKIAELAVKLEREELGNFGGRQDQYASSFGGINFLEFGKGGKVKVSPIRMKEGHVLELEKSLLMVYAAERSASGDIISDQMKRYSLDKGKGVGTSDALDKTKEAAIGIRKALESGDLNEFGRLLDEGWKLKKKFSPLISNSGIDRIYEAALSSGAMGGKISGAGGGGFMFFYCEPNKEHRVAERLRAMELDPKWVKFDFGGLKTWTV